MWRAGYRLLLWIAFPFVLARLWWRGRHEPAYRQNIAERFGLYPGTLARPVIWLHAVSVGETRAAEPLLQALRSRHPGCDLLITQMTATGREAAQQLFGGAVLVAWLPYDYPSAVRRFLRSFRPRLGILMETESGFTSSASVSAPACRFCSPMPECRPSRRAATPRSRRSCGPL